MHFFLSSHLTARELYWTITKLQETLNLTSSGTFKTHIKIYFYFLPCNVRIFFIEKVKHASFFSYSDQFLELPNRLWTLILQSKTFGEWTWGVKCEVKWKWRHFLIWDVIPRWLCFRSLTYTKVKLFLLFSLKVFTVFFIYTVYCTYTTFTEINIAKFSYLNQLRILHLPISILLLLNIIMGCFSVRTFKGVYEDFPCARTIINALWLFIQFYYYIQWHVRIINN